MASRIYSVAAVREIDRIAIEDHGIPGFELMHRAASAAFADAQGEFSAARRWLVFVGAGNNGGDGYLLAMLAERAGLEVTVMTLVDPARLSGDAARAHAAFVGEGGVVRAWRGALDIEADLIVDGLLGSGLDRPVEGRFAEAVAAINAHASPVHALDMPSGIHGDSGRRMATAVAADLTSTFVGLKRGLFLSDGAECRGALRFHDLAIPPEWTDSVAPAYLRVDESLLTASLPPRKRDAHKGDFGHLLVVGGGPGMPGAALLCGSAALRTGAGRVSLATHPQHADALCAFRPELMVRGVSDGEALRAMLADLRPDVIAFGPGLGRDAWARAAFEIVAATNIAAVWDADALNLLAEKGPVTFSREKVTGPFSDGEAASRVLTPHPGEAARLLGHDVVEVQRDRDTAVAALSARYGCSVVLKGSATLTCQADQLPWLCTAGNPGMATAGMGDVLTGVIAGLMSQGIDAQLAAAVGVQIHAEAGDFAAENGERGTLATDVIDALPRFVNR